MKQQSSRPTGPPPAKNTPLDARLALLNSGLPSNPAHSEAVVRRLAQTPLEQYLHGEPKAQETFQRILGPDALSLSYQAAAVQIRRLMKASRTRGTGLDLLWYLSFPLQVAYKRRS